jgi:uncharacterized protein (TIGR02217 family)
MAFFECEFPRAIGFQRQGGPGFNTSIVAVQSGQEQRNRAWAYARAEYQASLVTPVSAVGNTDTFIEQVRTFFLQVGGMADGFRFYDHLDCIAVNEPLVLVSGSIYQLQKTYTLGGRTYTRPIYKPITSSVINYQGVNLTNTVSITSGGTLSSVDHATGQVTLSGVSGTPHASFSYHIPVRLTSDKFEPEVEPSSSGNRVIKWNSLGLIEVRPPNY